MEFYRCNKNTGVFHSGVCRCTDNEAEADRIGLFGSKEVFLKYKKEEFLKYKYELQSIITKFQDFGNLKDETEMKKYNDAVEKYNHIKNY